MIFADVAYNKQSTKKWFPFVQEGSLNTSEAVDKVKKFYQQSEKKYEEAIQWEIERPRRTIGRGEWLLRWK